MGSNAEKCTEGDIYLFNFLVRLEKKCTFAHLIKYNYVIIHLFTFL